MISCSSRSLTASTVRRTCSPELVDLVAVEIGDARVGVEDRGDRAQFDLLGILLIVDIGGGEFVLAAADGREFREKTASLALLVDDTVDAVGARPRSRKEAGSGAISA